MFKFFPRRFLWQIAAAGLALAAGCGIGGTASADTPTSAVLSTLYSFNPSDTSTQGGSPLIGYIPHSFTAGPNNKFYALTQVGGDHGAGAVVSFDANLGVSGVVYAFPGSTGPDDSVMAGQAGSLYGTLANGGTPTDGAVYSLSADGSQYRTLHEFTAPDGSGINPDGTYPLGLLLQGAGGKLYGETLLGGPNGEGVVYAVNPDGSGFAVLHSFGSGFDGAYPAGGLIAGPDGSLYGITEYGGAGSDGTVFKIAPDGSGYAALYQFSASDSQNANGDGAYPSAGLTLGNDGLLYGVTTSGGSSGSGVIFQLGTDGSGFTALYAFSSLDSQDANGDGAYPSAALVKDASGNLFGTTVSGGSAGQGTVFVLSANAAVLNFLYSLGGSDGNSPVLTASRSGLIFGTTDGGGTSALGSVFSIGLNYPALHVLWTNTDGRASVWNLSDPNPAATCKVFGPYPGWTATAVAEGPSGSVRLLWNNTNGQVSVWNLSDANPAATCLVYGPYSGWTAKALAVGADSAAHLLWDNVNGPVSLWNLSDPNPAASCRIYGPYAGWSGTAIGIGPDNQERLLWNSTGGQASVWNLADTNPASSCLVYGPYSGWTAKALTVGPDDAAHLLWDNAGSVSLWNLSEPNPDATCLLYGPYSGWSGTAIAEGPDDSLHLLWDNVNGPFSLWNLSDKDPASSCLVAGPYSGWTAVGISAAP